MRLFRIICLCLALMLQGTAAWAVPDEPCPMEGMSAAAMDGDASAGAEADCCNDALTFLQTGQPCKSGMDCSAPAVHGLPVGLSVGASAPAVERTAFAATAPPLPGRSAIWRPPSPH